MRKKGGKSKEKKEEENQKRKKRKEENQKRKKRKEENQKIKKRKREEIMKRNGEMGRWGEEIPVRNEFVEFGVARSALHDVTFRWLVCE